MTFDQKVEAQLYHCLKYLQGWLSKISKIDGAML